jgi:tryptophan-rich sensory protein
MKALLTLMALLESTIGLVLLVSPALPASNLLGAPLDTPAGLTVGRVAGAALVALGIACWRVRQDGGGRSATGVIISMMFYNVLVVAVLVYAQFGLSLKGIGVRPAVFLHVVLAVWCLTCVVRPVNRTTSETPAQRP